MPYKQKNKTSSEKKEGMLQTKLYWLSKTKLKTKSRHKAFEIKTYKTPAWYLILLRLSLYRTLIYPLLNKQHKKLQHNK